MHSVHLPFNAAKCIVYMTKQIRIILLILDRQSKSLLANLGRILLFHFGGGGGGGETVIRDFLLDIYSAYKSFVRPVALGLEVSGSNDMF